MLVHHSTLHHHSLGSIHSKLLACWVECTHPFASRVVDSCPSVLPHPSGGHNCLTRCRLQIFLNHRFVWSMGIEPVNTVWTPIQLLAVDKSTLLQWSNENWCHTLSTPPHKTVNNDVIVSRGYEGDDDDKDVEDNALMVPDIHFVLLHALEGDGKCNGSKNNCFKLSDYLIFFPLNCR